MNYLITILFANVIAEVVAAVILYRNRRVFIPRFQAFIKGFLGLPGNMASELQDYQDRTQSVIEHADARLDAVEKKVNVLLARKKHRKISG